MQQPNLIYIFADQWRRQAVGFMNEDSVLTPRIDQFSEESVICTQAVSCTPLCSPHRAALMTGKYALSTGVYTNCKVGLDVFLSPDEVGIGDVLKDGGYATGYIGKWHLDLPEQNIDPLPESGAKNWDAYTPPGAKRHGFDYWYSYGTFDNHLAPHYWKDSPKQIQVNEWSVQHETDMALRFIEEKKGAEQPFSLFLSWNPPHSPFELVPEQYRRLYEHASIEQRANVTIQDPFLVHTGETIPGGKERWEQATKDYFAAISGIDEQFGKIIDALNEWGIADNTIVVLTSDHGELLGSHGMLAKHSWHEESIGVPLLIRWPEQLQPKVCDEVINTVDLMPTLLELAGLQVPATVEGNSAASLLKTKENCSSNEGGEFGETRGVCEVRGVGEASTNSDIGEASGGAPVAVTSEFSEVDQAGANSEVREVNRRGETSELSEVREVNRCGETTEFSEVSQVGQPDVGEQRLAFLSAMPGRIVAIEQFTAAGLNNLAFGWRAVRSKRYCYVVDKGYFPNSEMKRYLYDLQEDPYQLSPLVLQTSGSNAIANTIANTIANNLDQALRSYLQQTNDPFDIDGELDKS